METKKFSPKIGSYELSDLFMQQVKGGACDTEVLSGGAHVKWDKNVEGSTGSGTDGDVQDCPSLPA